MIMLIINNIIQIVNDAFMGRVDQDRSFEEVYTRESFPYLNEQNCVVPKVYIKTTCDRIRMVGRRSIKNIFATTPGPGVSFPRPQEHSTN